MILNRLSAMTLGLVLATSSTGFAQSADADVPAETTDAAHCEGGAAVWIAGTAEGSDLALAEGPLVIDTQTGGDGQSLFAFRVGGDEALSLRIEAIAPNGGDPVIELQQADGYSLETNDDAGGSLNSRIARALLPGDYCVSLNTMSGEGFAARLQVATADQAPLFQDVGPSAIANCTADTPKIDLVEGDLNTALAQGSVGIDVAGNQPSFVRFSLTQPQSLTLRASSDGLDPYIVLFDGTGERLAENDDADGLNARLDLMSVLGAGDYCLGVTSYRWGDGTIQVSAEALDESTFLANAYRQGGLVPPLGGDYPVIPVDLATQRQMPVLLGGSAKWFSFEVKETSVLIVGAYGSLAGADPVLSLFGPQGEVIANNDDYGDTRDARIGPMLLEPGRYSLALTQAGASGSGEGGARPVSLAFDHFVRAQ